MVKILTYEELNELINGEFYNYISSTLEMLEQDYYDIYLDEYKTDIKYVFDSNDLEIVEVKIDDDGYSGISDIKIIPYFDQKDEFYKKHKIYAGEMERIIVKYMGRGKEKNYPSEFISIADYNDNVYFSLKYETLEYDTDDTLYEWYDYVNVNEIAFTRTLNEIVERNNQNDKITHIEDLFNKAKELITKAEDETFVKYFKDELNDKINEFIIEYEEEVGENLMDVLFDIENNSSQNDEKHIERFFDELTDFFYKNSKEYVQYISENHAEILENIFNDFIKKHKITMPISIDEYVEENLKEYKYKVEFDEDGEIIDIEVCYDEIDCE